MPISTSAVADAQQPVAAGSTAIWIETWRSEAGDAGSLRAFASAIGFSFGAVRAWAAGEKRPNWSSVERLAELRGVGLIEATEGLWGEQVRATCSCGCGGQTVLPSDCECDRSHTFVQNLSVRCACAKCGALRFYHAGEAPAHRELCRRCVQRHERFLLRCVGYRRFRATRRAPKCKRSKGFTTAEIERSRELQATLTGGDGILGPASYERAFWDVASGTFRCGPCASASRLLALELLMVRRSGVAVGDQIQSDRQLREVQSDFATILRPGNPEALARAAEVNRARGARPRSASAVAATQRSLIVRAWSGRGLDELPKFTVRPCATCGSLLISANQGDKRHGVCARRADLARRGPGRPASIDWRRDLAWAIQRYLGAVPVRAIARQWGVDEAMVRKANARVMNALPPPDRVQSRFRPYICLLAAAQEDAERAD